MKNCECKLCIRQEYAKKIMELGSHQDKNEYIRMLLNSMGDTEMELEHDEMILDGTWPNAVDILERSLAKAKAKVEWDRVVRENYDSGCGIPEGGSDL